MLLIQGTDPHDGREFLLPPGGGLEFGELLEDAVKREMHEEVGIRLERVRSRGMLENMFRYGGRPDHELVFVYEADCEDPELSAQETVRITESNGEEFGYMPSEVVEKRLAVFPKGLFKVLGLAGAEPESL